MGIFKTVFNILIVENPSLGRTLHLTEDMNDQMVEFGCFEGMSLFIIPEINDYWFGINDKQFDAKHMFVNTKIQQSPR